MHRISVIFDNGEVTKVDSLRDALEINFFLVQEISGDKVRWFNKDELITELKEQL